MFISRILSQTRISLLDNSVIQQFLKYVLVGGAAFVIDYSLLYFLTEVMGFHYLVSNIFSFSSGLIFNYIVCIYWVFTDSKLGNRYLEFLFYGLIGIVGLGISELAMWIMAQGFALHYMVAKLISTAVVLVWNFVARKYLLFN